MTFAENLKTEYGIRFSEMGVLPVILMYFFIRELSAYNIKKVGSVSEDVLNTIIRFDAQGNTYFWGGEKLYRINASDKTDTIEGEFRQTLKQYFSHNMHVNNRGDVFIIPGKNISQPVPCSFLSLSQNTIEIGLFSWSVPTIFPSLPGHC